MATIYEVSKLAGVSLATVSRVVNKNNSVSDKTRLKVLKAMEQLRYKPNLVAKSLASSRSDCVGVLVSEIYGSFYGGIMSGVESVLRKADKHIVVTAGHNEEQREKDDIEFLISRNCDALILHVEALSDEYLINLCQGKTPVVILNRHIPEVAEYCISLDNELGGYLATKYILEQGHTNIAYISGPKRKVDALERLAGHKRALNSYGVNFDPESVYEGNYLQVGGSAGINYFLENDIHFTAVVCANDEMATGAIATARENGLDIPRDVSIFGFDNVTFASYTYPTLSTINYPISDMGKMAAKAVLKRVYKQEDMVLQNIFEPEIVERNSVRKIER
jgi:LacI family transcriptional regulator